MTSSSLIAKPSSNRYRPNFSDKLAMAVKITDNIYLGDQRASESKSFFDKASISCVLNMSPNLPNVFSCNDEVEYLRIPVHDTRKRRDENLMFQYYPIITEFIYKSAVIEKKNILIHCALGRQRSCAAVASYLIKIYKMTPLEAMELIVDRKPDAFHWGECANFGRSLNRWYYKVHEEQR